MTLDEIGTQLHISRERVRQIKVQTLRELRTTILSSKELVETLRN
jgi:DNA-directed RNA polymerase sigma subunit (sigma70/sigma32)